MAGKKGRSGRKRNPRNALRYFNELYDLNSYELAEKTIQKALDGDREMLIYCHDRRLGKPKATIGVDEDDKSLLSAHVTLEMFKLLAQKRRELQDTKLLEEGNNVQAQG